MSNLVFEPHSDKQTDFIFSQKNISIAATGIQWGKCLISLINVLTDKGYRKAKDIKLGDTLFDRDGKPTKVIGVYPQGLKNCYRIDLTDRKSFIVSDDHKNIIKRRGYAKEEVIETIDLYNRKAIWAGRSKAQIPSVKPIRLPEKEFIIDPYVMGAYLGNGFKTSRPGFSFVSMDNDLVTKISSLVTKGIIVKEMGTRKYHWALSGDLDQRRLFSNEFSRLQLINKHSYDKFIPDDYKFSSIDQRLELLRGLMDTDGTIHNNGSKSSRKMEYFTSSKALAEDVIWLVESLGGKAWINVKKNTFYRDKNNEKIMCRDCHRVNIISPIFNPFYIQRKAEKYFIHENTSNKLIKHIEPVGLQDTICFQVDSPTKTFVIEGQVVTHNSSAGVMRLKIAMHEFTHPTDNFIVTSPTYKILYQSTLPVFNYWNKGLGTYDKKNECFNIRGGGTVWFRTGVDPDSVVGITNVRHILCDEAGLYSLYFWENIQARASFKEAHIDIVTSPYSLNWLYRDYIRKHRAGDEYTREQVHLCQAKSCDNPYFPMAEYDKKRRTMEPRRFNMMYGGNFDKAQGLVYGCFDSSKHWIDPINFPEGTKFVAGIDWGYTHPFVIVVRAITPLGMHYQVAEFYQTQLMLNEKIDAAHRMRAMYPIEKFYADPANPDDIASFNQAGLRTVPANNDIKKGIEAHWELISSGCFAMFKGNNFHTADEYEMYHYPEQKDLRPDQGAYSLSELPVDKENHALDASRYVTFATFTTSKKQNKIITSENQNIVPSRISSDYDLNRDKLLKRKKSHSRIL